MRRIAFQGLLMIMALGGCVKPTPLPGNGATLTTPTIHFDDVTAKSLINFQRQNGAYGAKLFPETMGGGAAFIDYDNDGYQDILLINGNWWPGHNLPGKRPTLALYHNNHDGTFTDVTTPMGLNVSLQGMGVTVGDFDNDGFDDIYVTAVGSGRLFKNINGKKFVDVTAASGIKDTGWGTSAAWLDYDNDGKLDLFVCHYVDWSVKTDKFCGTTTKTYCLPEVYNGESCRLYHNDGNGRFTDVTKKSGIFNSNSKGLGVAITDINADGWPDIIVACDMVPNLVFVNQKNGTFKNIGLESGIAMGENGSAHAGMGIDVADYRNNGKIGLVIGNFTNDGLFFYDIDPEAPTVHAERNHSNSATAASIAYITFGLVFADFANQGVADLFAVNGHLDDTITEATGGNGYKQPGILLKGDGKGNFTDISKTAGPAVTVKDVGRTVARGDFDNDGLIDLLIAPNNGNVRLLKNTSKTDGNFLTVSLQGVKSNRNGFGASVEVNIGGKKFTQYSSSGSSYCASNDRRLHFGLGTLTGQARIVVRWPSGLKEEFTAKSFPGAYLCLEGSGIKSP